MCCHSLARVTQGITTAAPVVVNPDTFCANAGPAGTFTGEAGMAPSIPAGAYHLVVRADDGHRVPESNENNNLGVFGPITIN